MFSWKRLAAAAAAAISLLAALPAPATAAAAADVPFTLTVPEISFSKTGSYLPLALSPATPAVPASLTGVVIDVDSSLLSGIATVTVPGHNCTDTCSLGALDAAGGWRLPDLFVKAKAGAAVGASGPVKVTLSADGYEPIFAVATLTVQDMQAYAGPPTATYTVQDGNERATPVLQFTGKEADGGTEHGGTEMAFRIVGDPGLVFDVPRSGDVLCWRNTSAVRVAERFCNYSRLTITPGSIWQVRFPEVHAPNAKPGDKFHFEATYWLGPGARNVVEALKKRPGFQQGAYRGLYPPARLPDGTTGTFAGGSKASGTIVVGQAPTEEPPTSGPTTPPVTEPTTAPGTTEPTAPATTTTPPDGDGNGGVAAPGDAGGSGGGSGGALPTTGANVIVVAAGGAVLLAAGAAAFLIVRRRRIQFTA